MPRLQATADDPRRRGAPVGSPGARGGDPPLGFGGAGAPTREPEVDRTQLRILLATGPSRRLDVLQTTLRLQAEERLDEQLFHTSFLNRSILLKTVDPSRRRRGGEARGSRAGGLWQTLIYLPYDAEQPGDGGEALPYSPANLRRLMEARQEGAETWAAALEADRQVLDLLDGLPVLNPFLLREAFGRSGRAIPEAHLALDLGVSSRLRRRLDSRVRPLIVAALEPSGQEVGEHLERILEALLVPGRGDELRVLGTALKIEADSAADVLGAWAGIAFFEDELERLEPEIQNFARWLAHDAAPREYLPATERRELNVMLRRLRAAARAPWREIRQILQQYRDSYVSLVFEKEPAPFVEFLRAARSRYLRMGELFGAFEQSVYALEHFQQQFGPGPLPAQALYELLIFLEGTFHVDDGELAGAAAGGAPQ